MQPDALHVPAQPLPAFVPILSYPGLNPQQEEPTWIQPPSLPAFAEVPCRRPMFVPQAQQPLEFEDALAWWFGPPPRIPSWRIREIERQREMDRIAEPYIARLREVSRQKKAKAEARALDGQQKTDRAKEKQDMPPRDSLKGDEKKVEKVLREIERQQRSETKRQARKDAHEGRRRRNSTENTPPEGQEAKVTVSPRRKSSGRSKPYSIPHPATRSPRRSHSMPGGLDSDDLRSDQTGDAVSDAFWKGLRSAVDVGFGLWPQN